MAELDTPSSPQAFGYAGAILRGRMTRFSGGERRSYATHRGLKRPGAVIEDMEAEPRELDVEFVFTGPKCADNYAILRDLLATNPFGALIHPIAGEWQAFCKGPHHDVDFGRALDEIKVRVGWIETEIRDEAIFRDAKDPAAAAQDLTAMIAAAELIVAEYMGQVAQVSGQISTVARAAVDAALALVDTATSPTDFISEAVTSTVSSGTQVYGAVVSVKTKFDALAQTVESYVGAASDVFSGEETPASANAVTAELAAVEAAALDFEDTAIAASSTPGGAADAVGAVEEVLAAAYVLNDALRASRPPVVTYTVTELCDVITLAQRIALESGSQRPALALASDILGLNRIVNPAAIQPGTILRVPVR